MFFFILYRFVQSSFGCLLDIVPIKNEKVEVVLFLDNNRQKVQIWTCALAVLQQALQRSQCPARTHRVRHGKRLGTIFAFTHVHSFSCILVSNYPQISPHGWRTTWSATAISFQYLWYIWKYHTTSKWASCKRWTSRMWSNQEVHDIQVHRESRIIPKIQLQGYKALGVYFTINLKCLLVLFNTHLKRMEHFSGTMS